MMNVNKSKIALLLAAGAVSIALTGCGGDDGSDGNPGNPGGPAADYINTLNLKVTDVTYTDGVPTINVFATNEEDLPVVGLTSLEVKKVVQLIPQGATGAGNSAEWQYIGSQKEFVDQKNGNYSFTIPVEGYNSELTQRYNIIASASTLADGETTVPRTELSQDFSGNGYEATYTKNVVATETCNSCHAEGKKIYHGYTSSETCAACHTQDLADDKGKPQVAYNHLIHNVHNNAKMYGKNMDKSAETAHAIVQDNCTTCHAEPAEGNTELAEWGNWSSVPTMETCTSCHTGIDFQAGKGHSQQADNSNCIACHNASWTEEIHTDGFTQTKALIDTYGMNTTLAVNEDKTATVTVSLIDANGEAVNATDLLPQLQRVEVITNVGPNNVKLGYNGKDSAYLVLNGKLDETIAKINANGDFEYITKVLTFGADDADTAFTFSGLSMCSENGEFVNCDKVAVEGNLDEKGYLKDAYYTGMKADLAFATLSGEAPSMRHVDSVNFETCINCHGDTFEIHKGTHHAGFVMSEQLAQIVDGETIVGVDGCVSCHTPDGTYAGGAKQGALEMKLHKVHSQGDYAVIPGMNCDQCHNDFNRDAFKKKGAIATDGGQYTTPIAATCVSCHSYNMDSFKAHVEGQGALVGVSKEEATDAAQLETCFYCHAPTPGDHTSVKM
ncbi:OmcA/MtrC family decaheme c-type cytochrome [Shewanella pneumatophori]|uniref:OmcA/MtrC family decaheme c-type cytochrome n=1 Tax=Shewanella pneumatophori TaxID=314092 RepID=A0A9X2CI59_9GAMM|nr:OmcA/MtrC family decaheme c-type cytochrome [Shewanella pneumatophori]MCL1139084.1 OmcA/MtrC family decaheme c-type cytochrome [Shewanella pneumatophori]